MKIGIGVTTTVDSENWCGLNLTDLDHEIVLFNFDQTTIAKDKNKLIKQLYDGGCDYIFLFDDDTFPIKSGWEQFFIDAHLKTGIHHFNLCNNRLCVFKEQRGPVTFWQTGCGCMLFLTRACIDKAGYFNPAYGKYGYEHAAYSLRIHKSGLTPAWYVSVDGWEEYIYSWDLYGGDAHGFVKTGLRSAEERAALVAANQREWDREQASEQKYYPYAND